jgi:hypothetical protein
VEFRPSAGGGQSFTTYHHHSCCHEPSVVATQYPNDGLVEWNAVDGLLVGSLGVVQLSVQQHEPPLPIFVDFNSYFLIITELIVINTRINKNK